MDLPKLTTGQIIGGTLIAGAVAGLGAAAIVATRKRKKKKKTKSHKNTKKKVRRSHRRKLKFGSKAYRKRYLRHGNRQKKPHTAGRRKDTSHRRIRYTKNNQPYIIKSDGRARFISKKSVRTRRKMKGGSY